MNTGLETAISAILERLFGLQEAPIDLQETRKEFDGDVTLGYFPI